MRFTTRDLLWLIALTAMALGWCIDRTALDAAKIEAVEDARSMTCFFDPRVASEPKLEPVKTMLKKKYPRH